MANRGQELSADGNTSQKFLGKLGVLPLQHLPQTGKDTQTQTGKDTQKTDAPMGAAGQRMGVQRPTDMRISSWLTLAHAPNPRPAIRQSSTCNPTMR